MIPIQVLATSAVLKITKVAEGLSTYAITATLAQQRAVFLAANCARIHMPLQEGLSTEEDLYREAPVEVRRENSLHFVGPADVDNWLELVEEFRARGALLIVFTKKSRKELLEGLKLYLAWYADPGILKIQFEEGSEHLAKGLMTGVEAVLLETSAVEGWSLYLRPGVELDLDQLLAAR